MDRLPADICLKIFCLLDHQNLATTHQVCRRWKIMASENILWSNLFEERWGTDSAAFYAPTDSKSWKDVYIVQDRCDRIGLLLNSEDVVSCYGIPSGGLNAILSSIRNSDSVSSDHIRFISIRQTKHAINFRGLKIICEGDECYLVHQGEIQRHLGSRKQEMLSKQGSDSEFAAETSLPDSEPSVGILDKILFFLGDLEAASVQAKRARVI